TAAIDNVTAPVDEIVGDHSVNQLGERGAGQHDEVLDFVHRPAMALCEQPEYPPLRKFAVVRAQHSDQASSHPTLHLTEQLGQALLQARFHTRPPELSSGTGSPENNTNGASPPRFI